MKNNKLKMQYAITIALFLVIFFRLPFKASSVENIWNPFGKILQEATVPLEYSAVDGEFSHTAVDYKKIKNSPNISNWIQEQIDILKQITPPVKKTEKLAFWINAYNFFTLVEVRDHFPGKQSMKDIGWKNKKFVVNGTKYSLDEIEHEILRPLKDPRIHFAINCASVGCPSLFRQPYQAKNLGAALDKAVINSFENPIHIRMEKSFIRKSIFVTSLLSWFKGDFKTAPYESPLGFIHAYAPSRFKKVSDYSAGIKYDWALNTRENIQERMRIIAKSVPGLKLANTAK